MMDGSLPLIPDLYFPLVDVRDVALAHVVAAEREEAKGRFIVTSDDEPWPMKQMAGGGTCGEQKHEQCCVAVTRSFFFPGASRGGL